MYVLGLGCVFYFEYCGNNVYLHYHNQCKTNYIYYLLPNFMDCNRECNSFRGDLLIATKSFKHKLSTL
jgi:hypothetical protein